MFLNHEGCQKEKKEGLEEFKEVEEKKKKSSVHFHSQWKHSQFQSEFKISHVLMRWLKKIERFPSDSFLHQAISEGNYDKTCPLGNIFCNFSLQNYFYFSLNLLSLVFLLHICLLYLFLVVWSQKVNSDIYFLVHKPLSVCRDICKLFFFLCWNCYAIVHIALDFSTEASICILLCFLNVTVHSLLKGIQKAWFWCRVLSSAVIYIF